MKDLKAWVAAIRAEPDDDTVRLACADWFEERDQPERAEFIRVQCELARLEGDDPRRPDLARREDELLAAHEANWLANDLPAWARSGAEFRRGFVEHVSAAVGTLTTRAGGLLARAPVTSVRASQAHPADVVRLATCPHLAGLRHLCLYDFLPDSVGSLLAAPFRPRLRGLHLVAWSRSLDVDAVAPLLESGELPHLTHFTLDSFRTDVPGIRRLVRSGLTGQLDYLRLDTLMDVEIHELVAAPFARLRTLDLNENVLLTDEALRILAGSAGLGRLSRLILRKLHNVTDEGMRALAASRHLSNLVELDVSGTQATIAGVRGLIDSSNLTRLSRIDLAVPRGSAKGLPVRRWRRPAAAEVCTLWVRDVRT
jgi:uncharacterized protein (TIGR02996 family)